MKRVTAARVAASETRPAIDGSAYESVASPGDVIAHAARHRAESPVAPTAAVIRSQPNRSTNLKRKDQTLGPPFCVKLKCRIVLAVPPTARLFDEIDTQARAAQLRATRRCVTSLRRLRVVLRHRSESDSTR